MVARSERVVTVYPVEIWRGVRVVEGARLESVCTLIAYRGFESLPLRQINEKGAPSRGPFFIYPLQVDLNPRY